MTLDHSSVDDDDSAVRRGQTVTVLVRLLTSRPLTNVDLVDHTAHILVTSLTH